MTVAKTEGLSVLPSRIRCATAIDIPAIIGLEKLAASAAHWSAEQYRAVFSGEVPSCVALIVEYENELKGFLFGKALGEECEIENIVVAEQARGCGLGTMLLEEFLERARARNAKSVFLEVRESNLVACRLYEKLAFVRAGRRKRYYREPEEDAIVYRRNLS